MKSKTFKVILGVIVGIALFSMISSTISLLSDFCLMDDIIDKDATNGTYELMLDAKWAALATASVLFVALVCNVVVLISQGRGFKITAAALNFVTFVIAIVFLDLIRKDAQYIGGSGYATGAGYFAEMLQVAVPALVMCAYCIFISVTARGNAVKTDKTVVATDNLTEGGEHNEEI